MDANGRGGRPPGEEHLLKASEYFLGHRNLDGCRKYALQAQESNPSNATAAAVAQILAIVDVLAATAETRLNNRPDWYAILGAKRYSEDSQFIRNRFRDLILLLNPNKNKFAFADEAFELVRRAWAVLSNPSKKTQFDNDLRTFESETKADNNIGSAEAMEEGQCAFGNDTFWTVCPYCYYVYEYTRVYEECCLRCQNQNCGRGFHAVAISSPPPPAVVMNGHYWCSGFYPGGFEGGGGKKISSWMPFTPMFMGTPQAEDVNGSKRESFVEIYDGSDNSIGDEIKSKSKETLVDANGKKMQFQTVEVRKEDDELIHGCATNTEEIEIPNPSALRGVMKRKKSVAKNTKKMMGKGTRIMTDEPGRGHAEGMEMGNEGDSVMGGFQFFEGDDDIFVVLQDGF
ncbi:hypothetical protein U1Q18_011322 [Sarracenia purpurea var. burkii]